MPGVPGRTIQHLARLAAPLAGIRRVTERVLDDLRRDPGRGRLVLLRTIGITIAATAVFTVVLTALALTLFTSTADRLVAAGDVLVGATLLLAAIAAVVALLAYALSTGAPELQISVRFQRASRDNPEKSSPNSLEFEAIRLETGVFRKKRFDRDLVEILLRNVGSYSAKNPAVIVRVNAMFFIPLPTEEPGTDWPEIESVGTSETSLLIGKNTLDRGIKAVQWDGGPTYSIHGYSTRRLPNIDFFDLHYVPQWGRPGLTIEILAEGYRREIKLPVGFTVNGEPQFPRQDGEAIPEWI
jgi:hypothetical protein